MTPLLAGGMHAYGARMVAGSRSGPAPWVGPAPDPLSASLAELGGEAQQKKPRHHFARQSVLYEEAITLIN
jgi:hypothetical protein